MRGPARGLVSVWRRHYDQIQTRPPHSKPVRLSTNNVAAADEQVDYWHAISTGVAAAKRGELWREGVRALLPAEDRASVHIAAAGWSGKHQAHGDIFQALVADGDLCDISKPPTAATCKHMQTSGMLPPLFRTSLPWSLSHQYMVSPAEILAMKGITGVVDLLAELSPADALALACSAPSAILLAFALAAICNATGHLSPAMA